MTYALDVPSARLSNILYTQPYPTYPFGNRNSYPPSTPLAAIFPPWFHDWSLQIAVPVTFGLLYFTIAHSANHFQSGTDHSKGSSLKARALRAFVVAHNAGLCLYSLATFLLTAPVVFDLLVQGYRARGHDGLALAFCSIPTDNSLLGRWAYIFYLSKYYEVMDSVILYLKGKKIGNLQSYHHAGALFSMWIAYRFHAQPIWVFVVFNSGVHTLMYAYYFCAALKLPFPKTLKRNLTTLQILQIASGTTVVNMYYIRNNLNPAAVYASLIEKGIKSSLPASIFASQGHDASWLATGHAAVRRTLFGTGSFSNATASGESLMDLTTYAQKRMLHATQQNVCIETTGTALAIFGNTLYMAPLLVLFANFYIASYLKQQQKQQDGNGKPHAYTNGKQKPSK